VPSTVLIADNDPGVCALLAAVVRRLGCRVVTAADGQQAMTILAQGGVAVLVCDLDMPRASGQQVLQWSGRQPRPTPAIVVSGFVDAAVTAQLQDFGCVRAVMRKPFDLPAFSAAVAEVLASPVLPPPPMPVPAGQRGLFEAGA